MNIVRKKTGFTIVELLVVVGIIAIILVIMIVNLNDSRAASRDTVRLADMQAIQLALQEYRSMCSEYPNRLELTANNGCPGTVSLGDFISEIPENPSYKDNPTLFIDNNTVDTFNGYYYAGLSSSNGGPCYDYHLGVPLESGRISDEEYQVTQYLREDHDCPEVDNVGPSSAFNMTATCAGSEPDFEGGEEDSTYGVYDVRSTNTCMSL
jgi:prepilin-type N-terminal cleavage/methylation domain-containing protein